MVDVSKGWMKQLVKYRFTHLGCWIERELLAMLGAVYFNGGEVEWYLHRNRAKKYWQKGYSVEEIARLFEVPKWFARNWVDMWETSEKAWGNIVHEEFTDDDGRSHS